MIAIYQGRGVIHKSTEYCNVDKYEELKKNNPAPNTVIEGDNVQIRIQYFGDEYALPGVYALLIITDGHHTLSKGGVGGLKIFLNRRSQDRLRNLFPDRNDLFAEDEVLILPYCKIKILKYSEAGISARGELLID